MLHHFEAHQRAVADAVPVVLPALERAAAHTVGLVRAGGKVLAFGNGGSAAQAMHFATELSCRYGYDRRALPAVALAADPVVLTAVGNDLGYEQAFARQVEALARPGDLVVAISASGRSPNVLVGARAARNLGCTVVALTGAGHEMDGLADVVVAVPSADVARIQEVHAICLHAWADTVERLLAPPPGGGPA